MPPRSRVTVLPSANRRSRSPRGCAGARIDRRVVEHHARREHRARRDWRCPSPRCPAPCRARPRRSPPFAPMFAPGASPSPPTSPEIRSERMSPNRFVVTMTSKLSGLITRCIAIASTMRSSNSIVPDVLLRDLLADVEKEALRVLQDVRLVDERDFLATVCDGVLERIANDALRPVSRDERDRLGRRARIVADRGCSARRPSTALRCSRGSSTMSTLSIPAAGDDRARRPDVRVEIERLAGARR